MEMHEIGEQADAANRKVPRAYQKDEGSNKELHKKL